MPLQTICGTGLRVSEHKYINIESLKDAKSIFQRTEYKKRIYFCN